MWTPDFVGLPRFSPEINATLMCEQPEFAEFVLFEQRRWAEYVGA